MPKVHLDACCLNRPFDDQTQDRVRLESEAILLILNHIQQGHLDWTASRALEYEIGKGPDPERRERVQALLDFATSSIDVGPDEENRSGALKLLGFHAVDALHIACAESAACDVLLTTDDRLLRAAQRNAQHFKVRCANPVDWLREVDLP